MIYYYHTFGNIMSTQNINCICEAWSVNYLDGEMVGVGIIVYKDIFIYIKPYGT